MANPQTQDVSSPEELYAINAKWVNGVAPGYWPTAGAGLTLNLSAGAAFNGSTILNYAGGTLVLPNSTTSYVFLDTTSLTYVPAQNTTGFPAGASIPIAIVVTAGGVITAITDCRLAATAIPVAATIPVVIGWGIANGTVGNNVGPMLQPPHVGSVTKCAIVIKSSDGSIGLSFRIKQNGVDVFTSDPVVGAGTATGTTSTSVALTANPLSVAISDVFQIDILSGSANWAFTAQLES